MRGMQAVIRAAMGVTIVALMSWPSTSVAQRPTDRWYRPWMDIRKMPPMPSGPVEPNPFALDAKTMLDNNSGQRWNVQWSQATGLPTELWGQTKEIYRGTPVDIARRFMSQYLSLFTGLASEAGLGDITFDTISTVVRTGDGQSVSYVQFVEKYKGVPVHGSLCSVGSDDLGHVVGVISHISLPRPLAVNPALSGAAVEGTIRAALLPDSIVSFGYVRFEVFPCIPPRLIYEIWANTKMDGLPRSFEFVLDANSAEVLETRKMYIDETKPERGPQHNDGEQVDTLKTKNEGRGFNYLGTVPAIRMAPLATDTLMPRKSLSTDSSHSHVPPRGRVESVS